MAQSLSELQSCRNECCSGSGSLNSLLLGIV